MSGPLTLRVCCMAVMAPAVTEAASQSCIKVTPPSSPINVKLPSLATLPNGNSAPQLKTKPLGGLTSRITLGELKKIQQQGLLKNIGCQDIKFKVVADSEESLLPSQKSVLMPYQNGNHSDPACENMSTNHVNGNTEPGTKENGDNKHKINNTVNKTDPGISETSGSSSTNCNQNTSKVNNSTEEQKMVASSTELEAVSSTKDSNLETSMIMPTVIDVNLQEEVKNKQHTLERRTHHLLRRLRRLQSKGLESHLHSQLQGFVGFQHKNLQTVAKSIRNTASSSNINDVKTDLFNSDDVKSLSTQALVNLVRRLQTSQPGLSLSQRLMNTKSDNGPKGVLTMDKPTAEESARVSGILSNSLHHMQSCFDSDATESSSGGESCDDDEPTNSKKSRSTPLHRRADWKWSSERCAVASRWTWLQAQVSDLEYRIRQQSEIYKQIRHTKGPVLLGEQPSPEDLLWRIRQNRAGQKLSPLEQKIANLERKNEASGSPCNISKLMMNVNRQATKLTQSLGTVSPAQSTSLMAGDGKSKQLNGVIGASHGQRNASDSPSVIIGPGGDSDASPHSSPINHDVTCQASRCRPVRSYRKRKVLRTAGLHTISRKAARLSTVKCQCYPPISSCPMCGGRYNNVQRIDVDSFPLQDRVAILDPAFHPVLSFNQEIPLTIRFESHLKKGDWQNNSAKNSKVLTSEKRHQRYLAAKDKARKSGTKYAKSAAAALLSSAKLRNKYERRTPTKPRSTPTKKSDRRLYRNDLKKRRAVQMAVKKNRSISLGDEYRAMTPSPMSTDSDFGLLSASYSSGTLKEMKDAAMRKKKMENAYDINNIVIPYSMAASTRVEKLQYKEIVTPKWRKLEPEDNCDKNSNCDEEFEEVSDESFLERHHTCEVQERKRFSNFVQYPSRRSRSSRTDSDPNAQEGLEAHGKDDAFRKRSSSSASLRRMSGSGSFSQDDREYNFMVDMGVVEPWDDRTFPLTEEEYKEMLSEQPPVVEIRRTRTRVSLSETFGSKTEGEPPGGDSIPCSPLPSSSSGSAVSEDPNDPEWSIDNAEPAASKGGKLR